MRSVRPIRLPDDTDAVKGLDLRYTITEGYSVERLTDMDGSVAGFRLGPRLPTEPLTKQFHVIPHDGGFVAVVNGAIAAYAFANVATWNRRAVIEDFYVAPQVRRSGVGTALMAELTAYAVGAGSRCLWLETQNVNGPAVAFYRHVGFTLCGLDETLYSGKEYAGEVALYFTKPI